MKAQVFNAFWHGPEPSPLHWACMRSFPELGHRLRVFTYQPVSLPPGVERMDAGNVLAESEVFEFHNSYAAFANIFRYKLLLDEGGWWVDTDVYCQSEDIADCTHAWAPEDDVNINGAILKFPAGDPTLRAILADARETGRNVKVWGEIGPHLLTRHLAGREFPGHYGSTQAFYPVHYVQTHFFWLPNFGDAVRARCAGSPFVHLWAAMFRQYGIDIYKPAPQGSYLRGLAEHSHHPAARAASDPASEAAAMNGIVTFLSYPWVQQKWLHLFGQLPLKASP